MLDPLVSISVINLSALFTILGVSLAGSAHCAGMCGPLAVHVSKSWRHNLSYNLGRLCSYALVGAVAGQIGDNILGSESIWLQGVGAAVMAGIVTYSCWSIYKRRPLAIPLPVFANNILHKVLKSKASLWQSASAGMLTVALPCGWLFTFVTLAPAAGSAVSGALVMGAFWLGTTPVMTLVPRHAHKWLQPFNERHPGTLALLLGLSSFFVIGFRFFSSHSGHSCH